MPTPKRRKTHSRHNKAHAQWRRKATAAAHSECPQCHKPKLPHRVCPHCGTYDGRQVLELE